MAAANGSIAATAAASVSLVRIVDVMSSSSVREHVAPKNRANNRGKCRANEYKQRFAIRRAAWAIVGISLKEVRRSALILRGRRHRPVGLATGSFCHAVGQMVGWVGIEPTTTALKGRC